MECPQSSRFQTLLNQLKEEHMRELSALLKENEQLRSVVIGSMPPSNGVARPAKAVARAVYSNGYHPARADSAPARPSRAVESRPRSARREWLPLHFICGSHGVHFTSTVPTKPVDTAEVVDVGQVDVGIIRDDSDCNNCDDVKRLQTPQATKSPPCSEISLTNGARKGGATNSQQRPRTGPFNPKGEWQKDYTNDSTDVAAATEGESVTECELAILQEQQEDSGRTQLGLINPNWTFRLVWDVGGLILLGYDMIIIPIALSFEPDPTVVTTCMDWLTLIFWTFDMIMSFCTGYYVEGELVMDRFKIIRQYLKTWFVSDAAINSLDWVMSITAAQSGGDDAVGLARMFRGLRAMRVLRLLRLTKLRRAIQSFQDRIDSEYTFIVVNLIKLLLFILILNHIIACLWFWVGMISMRAGDANWVQHSGFTPVLDDGRMSYQYATALHWSLTQFTPASMDVSARSLLERIVSIIILFFAMVAFSSVIASITASMSAMRNMSNETNKQFWLLRRYLKQKRIARNLSTRILRYLEQRLADKSKEVGEESISILKLLSEPLTNRLGYCLKQKEIQVHPLFKHSCSSKLFEPAMIRLTHNVLKVMPLGPQDLVFSPGQKANYMFFVGDCLRKGKLKYTLHNEDFRTVGCGEAGAIANDLLRECEQQIEKKDGVQKDCWGASWVCEAALWTDWEHHGTLEVGKEAHDACQLYMMEADAFVKVTSLYPAMWNCCKKYSELFLEWLNNELPFPSDILLTETNFYDTAANESKKAQAALVEAQQMSGASSS